MNPSADLFKSFGLIYLSDVLKIKSELRLLIKDRSFRICKNLSGVIDSFLDKPSVMYVVQSLPLECIVNFLSEGVKLRCISVASNLAGGSGRVDDSTS